MTSYEENLKLMICAVEDQIVGMIESGNFPVRPVVGFLTEHMHDRNAVIRAAIARIIRAVKDAGYRITNDEHHYYIYR